VDPAFDFWYESHLRLFLLLLLLKWVQHSSMSSKASQPLLQHSRCCWRRTPTPGQHVQKVGKH
jgi:hypothetical protein